MFSIGICDDNATHRLDIKELCEKFLKENPQSYRIIEFSSGEEVLAYQDSIFSQGLKSNPGMLHLLFLDVEMGEMDGIEVLRKIEQTNWVWRVVFVTSHEEVVMDAFGIRTLGFVKKPVEYHQIAKWLQMAIRENGEKEVLEYTSGMQHTCILLEDIYFLEAEGNYTYLYTRAEEILVNDNLKQWQKRTEQMPLVRVHKSYLINMLHVQRWQANRVCLDNGKEISVGRQYAKEARERYLDFVKTQAMKRM